MIRSSKQHTKTMHFQFSRMVGYVSFQGVHFWRWGQIPFSVTVDPINRIYTPLPLGARGLILCSENPLRTISKATLAMKCKSLTWGGTGKKGKTKKLKHVYFIVTQISVIQEPAGLKPNGRHLEWQCLWKIK